MMVWLIGLGGSAFGGALAVGLTLRVLRWWSKTGRKESLSEKASVRGVPGWATGVIERCFFTMLVALDAQGVPGTMMGWLAIKLATNWNHPNWNRDKPAVWRAFAFTALLAGLVSMGIAYFAGWWIRNQTHASS